MKNLLLLVTSVVFITSCGGGGGGGGAPSPAQSATPTPTPTPVTYSYTKVGAVVTDYLWDSFAQGIAATSQTGSISGVYSTAWLSAIGYCGFDNYPMETSVIEPNESSLKGTFSCLTQASPTGTNLPIDLTLTYDNWNRTELPLYEYGSNSPSYALVKTVYQDSTANAFTPYYDYLTTQGIEYVTGAEIIVEAYNGVTYLLPTIWGDYTESGDMPSSGQATANFGLISYYHEEDRTSGSAYNAEVAVTGSGSITFNHTNNTLEGSFTIDNWMDLASFLNGTGPQNRYTTIPDKTIPISNGQIVGSNFTAKLSLTDSDVDLCGDLAGGFFGPNGKEIGATMIFADCGSNSQDYYVGGGFLLGE